MSNTSLKIEEKTQPALEEAQAVVGGYVEIVPTSHGQLLVNEEGRLKGLPQNPEASKIAGQPICGNALLLKGPAKWD